MFYGVEKMFVYLTPLSLFENQVIAVGKAILSSEMISDFERGVAIKVRDSLKSRKEEIMV